MSPVVPFAAADIFLFIPQPDCAPETRKFAYQLIIEIEPYSNSDERADNNATDYTRHPRTSRLVVYNTE